MRLFEQILLTAIGDNNCRSDQNGRRRLRVFEFLPNVLTISKTLAVGQESIQVALMTQPGAPAAYPDCAHSPIEQVCAGGCHGAAIAKHHHAKK
jgi:hypothetical protein